LSIISRGDKLGRFSFFAKPALAFGRAIWRCFGDGGAVSALWAELGHGTIFRIRRKKKVASNNSLFAYSMFVDPIEVLGYREKFGVELTSKHISWLYQ